VPKQNKEIPLLLQTMGNIKHDYKTNIYGTVHYQTSKLKLKLKKKHGDIGLNGKGA